MDALCTLRFDDDVDQTIASEDAITRELRLARMAEARHAEFDANNLKEARSLLGNAAEMVIADELKALRDRRVANVEQAEAAEAARSVQSMKEGPEGLLREINRFCSGMLGPTKPSVYEEWDP